MGTLKMDMACRKMPFHTFALCLCANCLLNIKLSPLIKIFIFALEIIHFAMNKFSVTSL